MESPAILQKAMDGKTRFFIQFGGQGGSWLPELAKYYQDERFGNFFENAFRILHEELERLPETAILPDGFELEKWLQDESSLPSEEYSEITPISMPMIQLTQLAHLENLVLSGYSREDLIRYASGSSGHSQGLFTATLLALGLDEKEFQKGIEIYTRYLFRLGVKSQMEYPVLKAMEEDLNRSEELNLGTPAPMAAIRGGDHDSVVESVEEFNSSRKPGAHIYIGLVNHGTNRIVSAPRSVLLDYYSTWGKFLEERDLSFIFLHTSCPFHSPYMEGLKTVFPAVIRELGYNFTGKDLKIPVYSFTDGANLQSTENLADRLYEEMTIQQLDWGKALSLLQKEQDLTILDFGPGRVSQKLTQDWMVQNELSHEIYAASYVKDLRKLTAG